MFCLFTSGTAFLETVHGIMKSGGYQGILVNNVGPGVRKLGLCRRSDHRTMHNSKPTSKAPRNYFKASAGLF